MESKFDIDDLFNELLGDKQHKHRKYTIEFKLKVVKLIEFGVSLHTISEKLKIDRKILRDWLDNKQFLLEVKNKNQRFRCHRDNAEKKIFLMSRKKK